MERFLLSTHDGADLDALSRQIAALGGKVLHVLATIKIINFTVDPNLVPAIERLPGVRSVEQDREMKLIN